jgi:hypothetical protein
MKVMVLSASPNTDGLTACACCHRRLRRAGADAEEVRLTDSGGGANSAKRLGHAPRSTDARPKTV